MRSFFIVLFMVGSLSLTVAAENSDSSASSGTKSGSNSGRERFRGRGGRGSGMMRRGGGFMEQIKKKYPKEFAEIEKLSESDPEKARSKMRDLMRKNMSENGMGRRGPFEPATELTEEQLKELKVKYPSEFAEYEKLKKSDPEKAKNKLQELMKKAFGENAAANEKFLRDRNRRATSHVIGELKRRYPEKMQEIEKLQKTDPDAARAELRKLFSDADMHMPRGHRELNYEYVPPQQMQNYRNGMMNRGNFPFGGGRMMGPWGRGGR